MGFEIRKHVMYVIWFGMENSIKMFMVIVQLSEIGNK